MNQWLNDNVKCPCPGFSGYLKRVEAAFAQAKADNIAVLALSFAIDSCGTIDNFIRVMDELHKNFAPNTEFLPDLALGYIPDGQVRLDEIFSANWFKGIDICNYLGRYSFTELNNVCQKAHVSKPPLRNPPLYY